MRAIELVGASLLGGAALVAFALWTLGGLFNAFFGKR